MDVYAGNENCNVLHCHTDEFPSKVRRPAYSFLEKSKVKGSLGIKNPYWT